MAEATVAPTVLISAEEIAERVDDIPRRLASDLPSDAIAVCLMVGGLWFAADLTRALARAGRPLAFDALWLASYGDARVSGGRCERLAGPQREVRGRPLLLIDDVADSGLSLAEGARMLLEAGAASVITAVFARKPWPTPRAREPDFAAWEAPARFLVGYGMDQAGALRSLPHIAALD